MSYRGLESEEMYQKYQHRTSRWYCALYIELSGHGSTA